MHWKVLAVGNLITLTFLVMGLNSKVLADRGLNNNKKINNAKSLYSEYERESLENLNFRKSRLIIAQQDIQFQQQQNLESYSLESYSIDKQFQFPTAQNLRKGEVVFSIYNRFFFFPDYLDNNDVDNGDTAAYNNLGVSWAISDTSQLSIEFQHFDSAFPVIQGDLQSIARGGDNEGTIEYKQRVWENESKKLLASGIISVSFPLFERGTQFIDSTGRFVLEEKRDDIVPTLQFPVTFLPNERTSLTLAPTIAFFPESSALFLRRPPTNNPGSFGTTFGLTGSASYRLNDKVTLWGDAFLPLTGNNTIERESGKPDKTIAFNAGFRYIVNPQVGIDVFATNTLGKLGALGLTADNELLGLGAGVTIAPDFIGANRRKSDNESEVNTPNTTDGLAFFDGGTVESSRALVNVRGGTQGFMGAFSYGLVKDLEASIFLDSVSGEVDESEQGFGLKARLLNQSAGDKITASLAGTLSLTNQPFANFRRNNRQEFKRSGLEKETPFYYPGADSDVESQLYIITLSLPVNYQFDRGASVWFTPILGYVQRQGTEIAGFNVGGSIPIAENFSVLGEVGYNFAGEGNGFIGNKLADVIPWNLGVRWDLANIFGIDKQKNVHTPKLELYVTNRVGSSTWHELRVRDQDKAAIGVGLLLPF
jgi:hypothetical protein